VYLPPYSPDLNPIEEVFSFIKKWIQRHGSEYRDIVEFGTKLDRHHFLYNAMAQVTADAACGWFHHAGYM
jgi:transposase